MLGSGKILSNADKQRQKNRAEHKSLQHVSHARIFMMIINNNNNDDL